MKSNTTSSQQAPAGSRVGTAPTSRRFAVDATGVRGSVRETSGGHSTTRLRATDTNINPATAALVIGGSSKWSQSRVKPFIEEDGGQLHCDRQQCSAVDAAVAAGPVAEATEIRSSVNDDSLRASDSCLLPIHRPQCVMASWHPSFTGLDNLSRRPSLGARTRGEVGINLALLMRPPSLGELGNMSIISHAVTKQCEQWCGPGQPQEYERSDVLLPTVLIADRHAALDIGEKHMHVVEPNTCAKPASRKEVGSGSGGDGDAVGVARSSSDLYWWLSEQAHGMDGRPVGEGDDSRASRLRSNAFLVPTMLPDLDKRLLLLYPGEPNQPKARLYTLPHTSTAAHVTQVNTLSTHVTCNRTTELASLKMRGGPCMG